MYFKYITGGIFMKRIFLGVVSTILATSLLAGCGESSIEKVEKDDEVAAVEASTDATEGVDNEEEVADEEATEEDADLTIGDTVNINGLHVTLNGIRTSEGEEFLEPNNDLYLYVDVTIENTTEEAAHISSLLQTKLYNAENYSQDIAIVTDSKGQLDGEVGPGRKMSAEVVFDVSESEYFEFIFEDPFMSGQAIWTFEIE